MPENQRTASRSGTFEDLSQPRKKSRVVGPEEATERQDHERIGPRRNAAMAGFLVVFRDL